MKEMPFHQYIEKEDDSYTSGMQKNLVKFLEKTREDIDHSTGSRDEEITAIANDIQKCHTHNIELRDKIKGFEILVDNIKTARRISEMRRYARIAPDSELEEFIERYGADQNALELKIKELKESIIANEGFIEKRLQDPRVFGKLHDEAYQENLDREQK